MGFLIFAFRKLTLKRKINQDEYRSMQLSQELQQVQSQMSIMQQAQAAKQDMVQQGMAAISNSFYASCQNSLFGSNQNVAGLTEKYQQAVKDASDNGKITDTNKINEDANVIAAKSELEAAQKEQSGKQYDMMFKMNAFQNGMLQANGAINSIFNTVDKGQMEALHQRDNRITLEMKNLESLLALEKAEYSSVEKAEGEAAKDTAPKFGLS